MNFPLTRLRRLRDSQSRRALFDLPPPPASSFIWPVFLQPGQGGCTPLNSMPGQYCFTVDKLLESLPPVVEQGIGGVLLFGQPEPDSKDETGSAAFQQGGVVQQAVTRLKNHYPQLVIMTDVCLCAYTTHGHCGVLDSRGFVENDLTNELLAKVAVSHAEAGADVVAPSAMMDGQVISIRDALDARGLVNTMIMAYSTKFASSFYGPFREAGSSAPSTGDRQGYQASYAAPAIALRESVLDEQEGADILMVKPALLYLDMLLRIRQSSDLPLAAYNVSGEYSMLHAAASQGYGDLYAMARESLYAIARAGADIVLSYWAPFYNRIFL